MMPFESRIDVHAHFIPPFYRTACEETGHGKPDGMPAIPPWSEDDHLAMMKDLSITKSIISISSPGVYLDPNDPTACRKLTRQCNEYAGDLVKRRPNQFGFWAVLPVPDIEAALEEIAFVQDTFDADGFVLETNHHGTYLGDPALDPVFAELNRRKAKVFIHPTTPCIKGTDAHSHTPVTVLQQFPNPMLEFLFDTARVMSNLFISGTLARCPDITFIIPHAGGTFPSLVQRFCGFARGLVKSEVQLTSEIVRETLKRQFYFDLAGFPFPDQIHGILRFVGPDKLMYGSDYPFTRAAVAEMLAKEMKSGLEEIFDDEETREAVYSGNARRLLGILGDNS